MLLLLFVLQAVNGDLIFGTRDDQYLNWNADQGYFGGMGVQDTVCDFKGKDKAGAEKVGTTGNSKQACQRACADSVNCNYFNFNVHGECVLLHTCNAEKFMFNTDLYSKGENHRKLAKELYPLKGYKKQGDKTRCTDSPGEKSFATFGSCRSQAAVDGFPFFAWTKEGFTGTQDPARVGHVGSCEKYKKCVKKVEGTSWDWALYKQSECQNELGDDKCKKLADGDMCDVMGAECQKACGKCENGEADAETVFMTTDVPSGPSVITYGFAGIGLFALGFGAFKHFTK